MFWTTNVQQYITCSIGLHRFYRGDSKTRCLRGIVQRRLRRLIWRVSIVRVVCVSGGIVIHRSHRRHRRLVLRRHRIVHPDPLTTPSVHHLGAPYVLMRLTTKFISEGKTRGQSRQVHKAAYYRDFFTKNVKNHKYIYCREKSLIKRSLTQRIFLECSA